MLVIDNVRNLSHYSLLAFNNKLALANMMLICIIKLECCA